MNKHSQFFPDEHPVRPPAQSEQTLSNRKGLHGRLLVIDDEETMRRSLADILRLEGYQVQTAEDGDKAIALLAQETYDLILLDLKMPGTDGLEVLRFAARVAPETQVVLLTAHGSLESAIEALRHGACDYLLKPATPEQILASVERGLKKRANISQKRQLIQQLEASLRQLKGVEQDQPYPESSEVISLGSQFRVDPARREIHWSKGVIHLTPTEGKLLSVLLANPRRVFTHRELVWMVQGYETKDWEAPEILRPLVSRLRRKLQHLPGGKEWIVSVRGTGYVFDPPEDLRLN